MRRLVLVFFAVLAVASLGVAAGAPEVEAQSSPYTQVVDNNTEDRFKTGGGWGTSSYGSGVSEKNYRFARPAHVSAPAMFRVKIPTTGDYAVYARWPKVKGLNASTPVGVVTTSGVEWTRVNQRQNGGRWVRIGVYRMEAGDDYSIMFSRRTSGTDYVGADAVKVQRVSSATATPPSPPANDAPPSNSKGKQVVTVARSWLEVPYRLGEASRNEVDCSGLTMLVYKKLGVSLPHSDARQYRYGSRVSGPPQVGDLVFFDEHGDGISHVGIYSGNGKLIHASSHFGKVTESEMKHIEGYVGARRLL